MTSILPANDDFTEFATPYGDKLCSYIRLRPWATASDTSSTYAIPVAKGDLHAGYFGTTGGNVYRPGVQFGSFKSLTGTGTNEHFCAVLWRQSYIQRVRVTLAFRQIFSAGTPQATSFRFVGVTARNSGGVFDDTVTTQEVRDNTGYWFLLANRPNHTPDEEAFVLLRVNAGVTTLLAVANGGLANTAVQNSIIGTKAMEMTVDDASGNPVLTCKYEGTTVFTHTDSSASKITTAGRSGFGMCRDRQESGFNSAHVAAWWEAFDLASNGSAVRDSFDRVNLDAAPLVTDGSGAVGRNLMTMWSLDIYGRLTYAAGTAQQRAAGLNRIQTSTGGGDMFSQIAANDLYSQSRSAVFNLPTPGGQQKSTGIYVRAAFRAATGNATRGYRARMLQDGTFSRVFIERVDAEGVIVALGAKLVTTGFGLVYGTDYELYVQVENLGGTGPHNGTPSIKVFVNDLPVTGWTGLAAGVTIGTSNNLLDGQSGAILDGSANGLLLDTSGFQLRYDTWLDELIAPPTTGDEDQVTIATSDECDGKTGTFTFVYDWPVEVSVYRRHNERRYETGHVNRILRSKKERRTWRISANAITTAERASMLAFWDSHKGTQIPFDFPDPEKPAVLVCAHFKDQTLDTILRNPNVHAFDVEIEELLEPA